MAMANPAALPRPRRRRSRLILIVVLVALCLVVAAAALGYFFLLRRPQAPARPVVLIHSPAQGEQVPLGQPLTVHAVARGDSPIVRVELWADGQLQEAQRSSLPGGSSPFPLVADWLAPTPGSHTLIARAFDAKGGRTYASVGVEAIAEADRDQDRVPDEADACPDEPGWASTAGCPDADGDAVPDAEDACPDSAGVAEGGGCPETAAGDRDGDGVTDEADLCPDEPGMATFDGCPLPEDRDGDEIADAEDACPDEPGPPPGCPVAGVEAGEDRDRIPNAEDTSPGESGPAEKGGCPDGDGDGVCDDIDLCPDEPGPPERAGCPETDAGDRDGDGVTDDVDLCPDEPGLPEHGGCPPPGEEGDDDGDGIPDDAEVPSESLGLGRLFLPSPEIPVAVEFQALGFRVGDDYDDIYCYPSLAGGDVERYAFEPLGERRWDIAADLGSRSLTVPLGEPVELRVEAGGDVFWLGPEGGWGTCYDLGSFAASHPSSDWDGHVITARSTGGDDGRWFEATYRLCAGSCDRAALSPPTLSLFHYGGDAQLVWLWGGDRAEIDGFHVYVDGARAFSVPAGASSQSVLGYRPLCGSRREYHITAYRGERESPPSNVVGWTSAPCPRVVRVTFEGLTTYDLGDDEWWAHGESVGPIAGSFWAQGTTEERLSFWAVDYGEWAWERIRGFRLRDNHEYLVQDIFDQIWTWIVGSMSSPYRVPEHNYVTVELGAYEDLTIGGNIRDVDSGNPSDTLFDGRLPLRAGEVVPGRHTIRDRNIELTILIDVLVGPEAGDKPDLTVADVTVHEPSGQLRVHVFNNAADLTDATIEVALARISTNELLDVEDWEHVTIPSGGWRILQRNDSLFEPHDLRVILDPNNRIEEMNERNNIYETP